MRRWLGRYAAFMERLERRWWVKVLLALGTMLTAIALVSGVAELVSEQSQDDADWAQTWQIVYDYCVIAGQVTDCDSWTDSLMAAQYKVLRVCLGVGLNVPQNRLPAIETCVLGAQKLSEYQVTEAP